MKCHANTLGQQPSKGDIYEMKMRSCLQMVEMKLRNGDGPKLAECVEAAPGMSCIDFETCTAMSGFDEGLIDDALNGTIGDVL